ncbi:hypothetical protein GKE82_09875 [Conexibacter sp. W3-3-2]|uniref:acyl-CoA dehydrogenase family protein n=1 Tax=Conexibacter sp. W3-3-2 TaxID=2675227 RepID=UPI0012B9DF66|nr:acyl-CoA dehydrogenase family protein [Conexibacter sp. W3-3-2]MTD44588.1 hypothetical protein [Conexibacter sp. W3-3-2]
MTTIDVRPSSTVPAPVERIEQLLVRSVDGHVETWDAEDQLPDAVVDELAAAGAFGLTVGPEHGGAGIGAEGALEAWRRLARRWIAMTGLVNTHALAGAILQTHGTVEQQRRWLPGIASRQLRASFSITEPQAGSDLAQLALAATPHPDGGFLLSGEKRWIAGGMSATLPFALVRTAEGLTCLAIPREPGWSATWEGGLIDKPGYRGVESAWWRLRDHHAPAAEVIGEPGRGARVMLGALNLGRVNVAARGLGIAERAVELALEESRTRRIGDGPLLDQSHTRIRLGEMRTRLMAADALARRAAQAIDADDPEARDLCAAAKVAAARAARENAEDASRLAASRSYVAGCELDRLRRDAGQLAIGEGAEDVLLLTLGGRTGRA